VLHNAINKPHGIIDVMKKVNKTSELTFEDFSKANFARCESEKGFNHPVSDWTSSEWLTACLGELGEVAHVVKTILRQRDNLTEKNLSRDELNKMLAEEIADTIIYLDMLAQSQGINIATAIFEKFNKTSNNIGSDIYL
jgi:NTP pyrophosphatase (non-canonical NTP hydrolase)